MWRKMDCEKWTLSILVSIRNYALSIASHTQWLNSKHYKRHSHTHNLSLFVEKEWLCKLSFWLKSWQLWCHFNYFIGLLIKMIKYYGMNNYSTRIRHFDYPQHPSQLAWQLGCKPLIYKSLFILYPNQNLLICILGMNYHLCVTNFIF